eukprot:scaffold19021_cov44-Attheya_sp.AAC.2
MASANDATRRRGEKTAEEDLEESFRVMEVQLKSALETIEGFDVKLVERKEEQIRILVEENQNLTEGQNELQKQLRSLKDESKNSFFTFDDLYPGGALENHVGIFAYFPTVKANELFLEALNYSKASTSLSARKEFQSKRSSEPGELLSDEEDNDEDDVDDDDWLNNHGGERKGAGRKRKLDWKTEWLIYNCYVRCGFRMKEMEVFFYISDTVISDIVYAWANLLNDAFGYIFPTPT